ncbi:MAG TPA: phosphate ABC transporter ATP-binding protein PstB [Candidatus Polarisedimenticolia bacterium]|nr:phosphate ABC transporter ATP-binding protein PstB [Candidatus Polarisedimenticolia bacterium]
MASAMQGHNAINARLTPQVRIADPSATAPAEGARVRFEISNLDFFYGPKQVIFGLSLKIPANNITALIGPSGCGKSTFLRTLNRMNETIRHSRYAGEILLDGLDIRQMDVVRLRKRVGMVFQRPNPFPKSIYDNVAYGLRINGYHGRLSDLVEHSLRRAALWDEVKDYLHKSALALSGGQQQRLCIARALAVDPEVLLLDEPCSALDPVTTAKIEELMFQLKDSCTLVIVTHNMQQAARASDYTAFMLDGRLIEHNETGRLFTTPSDPRTEAYITGRFG